MERHFNVKILSIYTNGGGEYKSLDPYLQSNSIEHLLTPPYTPKLAERRHWHIIELDNYFYMKHPFHYVFGPSFVVMRFI